MAALVVRKWVIYSFPIHTVVAYNVSVGPIPQRPITIPQEYRYSDLNVRAWTLEAPNWYAAQIIFGESGNNYMAKNKETGAYGLCQALPAEKMATHGNDYLTNPETQLRWCDSYALERYGSWRDAYLFWIKKGWW